jgi:hypothetical protein
MKRGKLLFRRFFMNRADYYTKKIFTGEGVKRFRDGELSYSCGYPC